MRRLRGLLLFLLVPAVSAVAPLLVYPAVTSRYGAEGFAVVAIGQALGLAASVICELGWTVVGPQLVARQNSVDRAKTHAAAFSTRLAAVLIAAPIVAFTAASIVSTQHGAAAAIAAGMTLSALGPAWFLTGLNRPGLMLLTDALPRVVLSVAAALAIAAGAPIGVLAFVYVLGVAISLLSARVFAGASLRISRETWAIGVRGIRAQAPLTVGRAVSVAYTSLLTPILGLINPAAVPAYAATDRIARMGLGVLTGFPNRLQSWIGSADSGERRKRSRTSLMSNVGLGILAGATFAVIAGPAAEILFTGTVPVPPELALVGAFLVLTICSSRGFGLSLVAEGKSNWIAVGNVAAAIAGLVAIFVLAPPHGALGALCAALIAELVGTAVQAVALFSSPGARPAAAP